MGNSRNLKLLKATLIAGGISVLSGTAQAADLGGDCCADLEERVATLEATTARKGNRKVSLTVSGSVNQALFIWDDGVDSDAYIVDNTNLSTRFRFAGSAAINSEWSAGYEIEIQTVSADSTGVSQSNDDGFNFIGLRKSYTYVKSKSLGKLSLGLLSPTTDDMVFAGDVGGIWILGEGDVFVGSNLGVSANNNLTISHLTSTISSPFGGIYDGLLRQNAVRYDTPSIGGFTVSAAIGEDDFWDVAIRTSQKIGDFSLGGAIGYSVLRGSDITKNTLATNRGINKEEGLKITAGVIHNPTGIFLQGAYYTYSYETNAGFDQPDSDNWQIQAGIKQRWNSLGDTKLYGVYAKFEDSYTNAPIAEVANGSTSEATSYKLGIIQHIDAASMQLYAGYEHVESELNNVDQKDLDTFTMGGVIFF